MKHVNTPNIAIAFFRKPQSRAKILNRDLALIKIEKLKTQNSHADVIPQKSTVHKYHER